jgi:hypothetical protein
MICLVGDQAIPNVLGALLAPEPPQRVVCLVSRDLRHPVKGRPAHKYDAIYTGIDNCLRSLALGIVDVQSRDVDAYQVSDVLTTVRDMIRVEFPEDRIIVNLTGGTKLMAQGALRACQEIWADAKEAHRVSALYVDTDEQQLIRWSVTGDDQSPEPLSASALASLDIERYFLAYGVNLTYAGHKVANDSPLIRAAAVLATQPGGIELARAIASTKPAGNWQPAKVALLGEPVREPQRARLNEISSLANGTLPIQDAGDAVRVTLEGDWQHFFWGRKWLEYYAYGETIAVEDSVTGQATYNDVRLNVRVDWQGIAKLVKLMADDGERDPNDRPVVNELDVVASRGARLLVCECKTDEKAPSDSHLYKLQVVGARAGTFTDRLLVIAPEPRGFDKQQYLRALTMDIVVANVVALRETRTQLREVLRDPETYLREQKRVAGLLAW